MSFLIKWTISETEWKKAIKVFKRDPPSSEYDKNFGPHYDLLYGDIQFIYGEATLFKGAQESQETTYNMSLADLAHGLNHLIFTEGFEKALDGSSISFQQADDNLQLYFEKHGDIIQINANLKGSNKLLVPEAEFFAGTKHFLTSFIGKLVKRAPYLLNWQSLASLSVYK